MIDIEGNVWEVANQNDAIVIPTNIGWNAQGKAVMGKGLAGQAAQRFPTLRSIYGPHCQVYGIKTPLLYHKFPSPSGDQYLILFPTKPFNENAPFLSWKSPADISLVKKSLQQLATLKPPHVNGKIYVPFVGCGLGGLQRKVVGELMDQILIADYFIRIQPKKYGF